MRYDDAEQFHIREFSNTFGKHTVMYHSAVIVRFFFFQEQFASNNFQATESPEKTIIFFPTLPDCLVFTGLAPIATSIQVQIHKFNFRRQ